MQSEIGGGGSWHQNAMPNDKFVLGALNDTALCSWRLVEAAQGIQNALPNDKSVLGGLNEATYLAQQAKSHGLNVMRLFGIADVNYSEGSPLQPSPGLLLGLFVTRFAKSSHRTCSFCSIVMFVRPPSEQAHQLSLSHVTQYQQERALCGQSRLRCSLQAVSVPVHGYAGQYNEQVFKAIDFILNEMSKQGIKVIVALVDYWKMTDGVQQVCYCSNATAMFHVSWVPAVDHLLGTHTYSMDRRHVMRHLMIAVCHLVCRRQQG